MWSKVNTGHCIQVVKVNFTDEKLNKFSKDIYFKDNGELGFDIEKLKNGIFKYINSYSENICVRYYTLQGTNYGVFDCFFDYKCSPEVYAKPMLGEYDKITKLIDIVNKNSPYGDKLEIIGKPYYLEFVSDENVAKMNNLWNEELNIKDTGVKSIGGITYLSKSNFGIDWINADDFLEKNEDDENVDTFVKESVDIKVLNGERNVFTTYQVVLAGLIKKAILMDINDSLIEEIYKYSNGDKNITGKVLLNSYNKHLSIMRISNKNNFINDSFPNMLEEFDNVFETNKLENDYESYVKSLDIIIDTSSKIDDIKLADMLNTIQIASIVLTILGWLLVIFQSRPNGEPLYIGLIIVFSIVSVTIAIVIKNVISKKKSR